MAHQFNTSPNNDPRHFGARVFITAQGLARGRYERGSDAGAHDMAMLVFLQFWSDPARWMATYTPEKFAAVSLRKRAEDWRRSERIQRGQGARIVERNGERSAQRDVGSLDEITEHIGETVSSCHDVAETATTTIIVNEALDMLTELQRELVWRVDVEGYTVVETSRHLDKSRAYCQRELGKAREFIREYVIAA